VEQAIRANAFCCGSFCRPATYQSIFSAAVAGTTRNDRVAEELVKRRKFVIEETNFGRQVL
jgi:hypothetical protein